MGQTEELDPLLIHRPRSALPGNGTRSERRSWAAQRRRPGAAKTGTTTVGETDEACQWFDFLRAVSLGNGRRLITGDRSGNPADRHGGRRGYHDEPQFRRSREVSKAAMSFLKPL